MILKKLKTILKYSPKKWLLLCLLYCGYAVSSSIELYGTEFYEINIINIKNAGNQVQGTLEIKLKDGASIVVQKDKDGVRPEIILSKTAKNIKSFEVTWPNLDTYEDTVLVPLKIEKINNLSKTELSFDLKFVSCKEICSFKQHSFSVDLNNTTLSNSSIFYSLHYILLIAFVGGLLLNVMPCVLPVISLKLLSLAQFSWGRNRSIKPNLVAISAGIISCFIILGIMMISVKSAGDHFGLGFTFQEPLFLIILVLILTVFASGANSSINIDIPSSWKTFLSRHSDESKIIGSFLSGMFATFLATPCTAPFIGTAMSVAFSMSSLEILLVFIFIGLGMSVPFIMFIIFPSTLNLLHITKRFMNYVKYGISIMIYLTVMWVLWILYKQIGLIPAATLFLICLLLKFILEVRVAHRFSTAKSLSIAVLLACGLFMPLQISRIEAKVERVIDSEWQPFSYKKLSNYIKSGNVVLVDVTADWCLTCKYNKVLVLNMPSLLRFAKENKLVLLRADYTKKDDEITDFLAEHQRYGIPFNIVFSKKYPKGIALPVLLKHSDIVNAFSRAK